MSAMTNVFETLLLNTMRGMTATAPGNIYIALFLSSPTETGVAGTEVSYTGYARQQLQLTTPVAAGTTVTVQNSNAIEFPLPSAAGGTVTHTAICDAATGGNVLVYKALANPIVLTSEIQPKFDIGDIILELAGGNVALDFKTKIFNYLRGQTIAGFTPYYAMYSGDPNSGGAELSGTGYERLELVFDEPREQVSGQMQIINSNIAQTAPALSNWGNWAYGVIMDAASGGNRVWHKSTLATYTMNNSATAVLAAGAISLTLN